MSCSRGYFVVAPCAYNLAAATSNDLPRCIVVEPLCSSLIAEELAFTTHAILDDGWLQPDQVLTILSKMHQVWETHHEDDEETCHYLSTSPFERGLYVRCSGSNIATCR